MSICSKELQQQIFLDNSPFPYERVPVFKLWSHPGPLVPWERGGGAETLVLGAAGSQSSLLRAYFSCMAWNLGLLILKGNSVSCQEQDKTILSWFCGYILKVEFHCGTLSLESPSHYPQHCLMFNLDYLPCRLSSTWLLIMVFLNQFFHAVFSELLM